MSRRRHITIVRLRTRHPSPTADKALELGFAPLQQRGVITHANELANSVAIRRIVLHDKWVGINRLALERHVMAIVATYDPSAIGEQPNIDALARK